LIFIKRSKFAFCIFSFLLAPSLFGLSLEEVWNLLQKSKELYQLQDKSPVISRFGFGFEGPQSITKEAVGHEVFQFCFKYLEKNFPTYKPLRQRNYIRQMLVDVYGEQIFQNLLGKSTISCYSSRNDEGSQIRIDFYSDRSVFKPFRWDYFNKDGILYLTEEDEQRIGRIESTTLYASNNCKKEIKKDKNGYGGTDEWWTFEKCNLVKIEYDENENGYKERTCSYENGKLLSCQGVGELEEKSARLALAMNDTESALIHFQKANDEIKKEFNTPSFKSCVLLKEIIGIEFQKKDFIAFGKHLDEFFQIPQCEKSSLEILIYKAYYLLYLSKNFKEAKLTYRKASEEYFKINGEENPELILNLSFAEYSDNDPLSCLASLERLRERRMLHFARFYFFYYRASCNQMLSKYEEAIEDFRKALKKSENEDYHPLIHFKIANSYYALDKKTEGTPFLVLALNKNINLLSLIQNDPLYAEFFQTSDGKQLISKYYLNQKQK